MVRYEIILRTFIKTDLFYLMKQLATHPERIVSENKNPEVSNYQRILSGLLWMVLPEKRIYN